MKKKRYIKPVVSVMEMETTAILAGSVIQKGEMRITATKM